MARLATTLIKCTRTNLALLARPTITGEAVVQLPGVLQALGPRAPADARVCHPPGVAALITLLDSR